MTQIYIVSTGSGRPCDLRGLADAAQYVGERARAMREIYLVAATKQGGQSTVTGDMTKISDSISAWDEDRMKQLYVVAGAPSMNNASLECMAKTVDDQKEVEGEFLFRPGCTLRVLISYHYYKNVDLQELVDLFKPLNVTLQLFADSGAYSAFAIGAEVNPDEYIEWIVKWQDLLHVCAAPDVIGDAAKTNAMTTRMLALVDRVTVLPVFHVGEDWSWLPKCVEMSEYIALGGMVPYTTRPKVLMAWVAKAFTMIPEETKVHGFGVTAWPFVKRFPWASVDSSTWATPMRYGRLHLFDDRKGKFKTIPMQSKTELLKHAPLLRKHGLDPRRSQARDYDLFPVVSASIEAWLRAEAWLNKQIYLVGIQDPQPRGRGLALMHAAMTEEIKDD